MSKPIHVRSRNPGFHTWGVASESRSFSDFHKYIDGTTSVLDVGCGDGVATRMLTERLKPKTIRALEPGVEHDFPKAKSYLAPSDIVVENLKLQDAACRPEYAERFDVATVFKYNAGFVEKDSFAHALSNILRPGGVALITVVEHDRICFGHGFDPALYIGYCLSTYFCDVKLEEIRHCGTGYEGLIICKKP